MSELDLLAALGVNGIGFVLLYIVVDRGTKAYDKQQEHDRAIITELIGTVKELCSRCLEDERIQK